nr:hypothetical protein BaRGS_032608 [Batillaria attramentaria]
MDAFRSHVCYGSLGCFSNDDPFSNAWDELPESPKDVGVTLTLYTRHDPDLGHELDYKDAKSMLGTSFDPSADIKVIIHGYDNDGTEDWVKNLTSHLLQLSPFNIIKVAWGPGAHKLYPQSVANTRVVGAVAAQFLTSLRDALNISMSHVHLLGHSLGAHIAGYMGTRVGGIGRISGMDPAGPLFESSDARVRIDPNDAMFVDCIHTDGVPLKDLGFGTMSAWCDADYYPNGGGQQPGCPKPLSNTVSDVLAFKFYDASVDVSCSHSRSHEYYVNSIALCRFPATPCDTYDNFKAGKCTCGPAGCPSMGYHSVDNRQKGKFFLDTTLSLSARRFS